MKGMKKKHLALAISAAAMVSAAPLASATFTEVTGESNPFSAITTNPAPEDLPSLALIDLDDDGDLDAVVFHQGDANDPYPYYGSGTSVYENTGTPSAAVFTQVTDFYVPGYGTGTNFTTNPFTGDYDSSYGHPVTTFDADGDDVTDFIGGLETGSYYGTVALTEVDVYGTATGAAHYASSYDGYGFNPFYGAMIAPDAASYGYGVAHAAGDLDNDEDMDLITTDWRTLRVWENNGVDVNTAGIQFNELTGGASPFYAGVSDLTSAYYGAPGVIADVNDDDLPDYVMGTNAEGGDLRLFLNVGGSGTPDLDEVNSEASPIDVTSRGWAAPVLADIDNDGDMDLIVVESYEEPLPGPVSARAVASTNTEFRLFINETPEPEPEPEPEPDDGLSDAELAVLLDAADDDDDGVLGSVGLLGLLAAALGLRGRRRKQR